ncbi:rCG20086, isoform CRA_a [Rattus norvegicus]|uniref:RCG20086, isoform CRA_a n=1 Tax=Rattus norvegicus TaxID=10116 RepID=A6JGA3_RAT|nr:rCG20086, isoform CRA_a [Rattus norvegicus]
MVQTSLPSSHSWQSKAYFLDGSLLKETGTLESQLEANKRHHRCE